MPDLTAAVMQVTETGEEFCAFTGTESECGDWINENEEQYPESRFYMQFV